MFDYFRRRKKEQIENQQLTARIEENTTSVGRYMKSNHSAIQAFGDFYFEYLYTVTEPIKEDGALGSVIYIRVDSERISNVASLPPEDARVQKAISSHQAKYSTLPDHLARQHTRWLYFNLGKIFRAV